MIGEIGVIRNGKIQPPSWASMVGGCCHDCTPWSESAVCAKDAEHVIRGFLSFQAARELLEAGEERFATAPLTESMPSFLDKLPGKEIIIESIGRARLTEAGELEIAPWDEVEQGGMQWLA
jgi:hypothetical protein